MMRCEDLLALFTEYVDGEIDAKTAAAIERHLAKCPACELIVDNIRKTISVFHAEGDFEMPPSLHVHLEDILHNHWKQKFNTSEPPK